MRPVLEGDREIGAGAAAVIQRSLRDTLVIWTVTTGTTDHGERYTARPHRVGPGKATALPVYLIADTLDQLREMLPVGLTRMARDPGDDPVIVENWL